MPESLCHVQSEVYREEASFQCVEIDFRDIQGKLGISCVRDIKKGEFQLKKKKGYQHQILWRWHGKKSEIGHWV